MIDGRSITNTVDPNNFGLFDGEMHGGSARQFKRHTVTVCVGFTKMAKAVSARVDADHLARSRRSIIDSDASCSQALEIVSSREFLQVDFSIHSIVTATHRQSHWARASSAASWT